MSKIDISKDPLYIKSLIRVVANTMTYRGKAMFTTKRRSDALIYILEGSCRYTFDDGQKFTVHKDDILYLADSANYRMDIESEEYKVLYFDFFFDSESSRQSAVYSPDKALGAEALFRRMYKIYSTSEASAHAECMSLAYKIYAIVEVVSNNAYINKSSRQRIQDIKSYIDKNCSNASMCIASLTAIMGTSEVYFRRIFKSMFHISPSKYIQQKRLENALSLMEAMPISIEDCALQSGFSSVSYFSRVFKETYGVSPNTYRNRQS